MKIGLIGWGFINRAIAHAFCNDNEILFYSLTESNSNYKEICEKADFIFIAVPTPMKKTGEIDLSAIDDVLKNLSDNNPKGIIIIKSTIIPGSTRKFADKYKNLKLVFNPEWLTERSAKIDMINASRIVISGNDNDLDEVEKMYRSRFVATPIFKTNWETAELIKYMCNNFFASKVIMMNIYYQVAKKIGADWDTALHGFLTDYRIGNSHYQVPGHDGHFGFGGSCFVKDINAFIYWLQKLKLFEEANFFEAVWKLNLKYRPEKDWENLKGRAISNEKK